MTRAQGPARTCHRRRLLLKPSSGSGCGAWHRSWHTAEVPPQTSETVLWEWNEGRARGGVWKSGAMSQREVSEERSARVQRAKGGPNTTTYVPATALRAGPRRWVTGRLYPQKTERRAAEPPAWTFFFVYSGGKQCLVSWNGAGLGAVCLPTPEHGEYSFCREGEAG